LSFPINIGNTSENSGLIPLFTNNAPKRSDTLEKRYAVSLTSFGVRFELSANKSDLLRDALLYLPLECKSSLHVSICPQYSLIHCNKPSPAEVSTYRLYRNGRKLFACADRREFLDRFRAIVSLYVAEASRRRTFIHAGVVGWGESAVLIPGRSFAGKTTLVAELVRAGATYYSDEFAAVDNRGMVHPYAQPLQVRDHGSDVQTQRRVEEFGGVAGRKPLPVGLIIVSRYKPEAQWRPRRLSPGIGLLKTLDNTVSARRSPAIALGTLKQVVSNAVIVSGARGEAQQVIDWIATHFGSHQKHSESPK
jgi:hypothetical protein